MKIQHNGAVITENIAPYSVAGDINGAFNAANLSVGTHTLIATPYPLANAGGTPGPSMNISFVVVNTSTPTPTPTPTPTANADSCTNTYANGMTLSASLVTAPGRDSPPEALLPAQLSISPHCQLVRSVSRLFSSTSIGSMKIQHNGRVITENIAPYSLAGDTNGAFTPANLSVGTHTVIATPYPRRMQAVQPGPSMNISFVVVDNPIASPPVLLTQENSDHAVAFNAADVCTRALLGVYTGKLQLRQTHAYSALRH